MANYSYSISLSLSLSCACALSVSPCVLYVCMSTYVFIHERKCGSQRLMLHIFLCWSLPYIFKQGLSVNLMFNDWIDWLASEPASTSPVLGLQANTYTMPSWLCRCWGTELRSSCLQGKHFTYWDVSPELTLDVSMVNQDVVEEKSSTRKITKQASSILELSHFLWKNLAPGLLVNLSIRNTLVSFYYSGSHSCRLSMQPAFLVLLKVLFLILQITYC